LDKHARILIVDDDESIRNTTKAILEDEAYDVDVAATGKEAIRKAEKSAYNIVLLDIRLPDMEGTELLKLMKETVPPTRKIIITGYPSMQNAITALNRNADAYLVKPINIENLLKTVKEQLQLQENERLYSEQKIAEFIETRVKELSVNET
jgi:DNA-binding NtrC family response regulator